MSRDAIETFEKALEQDRNLAEAWMGKGNVLYDLGKHTEAQSAYEKSLDLDPENAIGWTRHGMALAARARAQMQSNHMNGRYPLTPPSR